VVRVVRLSGPGGLAEPAGSGAGKRGAAGLQAVRPLLGDDALDAQADGQVEDGGGGAQAWKPEATADYRFADVSGGR
jgi:hypothetical protein